MYCSLQRVGWIYSQENIERDFIISSSEMIQMASIQNEIGEYCVTAIVSLDKTDSEEYVHFEVLFYPNNILT